MNDVEFDAIVVGSGISGGWAAKELTEKGLKVLLLERGAPLQHGKDYTGEHVPPWKVPFRGKPLRELYKQDYRVQSTSYSFGEATRDFWLTYARLPPEIQERARKSYRVWRNNPRHPSLHFKKVGNYWSVRVTEEYRALGRFHRGTLYWFWIGAHDEYLRLID